MLSDEVRQRAFSNPYVQERKSPFRFIVYAASFAIAAAIGVCVWIGAFGGSLGPTIDRYALMVTAPFLPMSASTLGPVYAKLGLKPRAALTDDEYGYLERLSADPCDNQAIYGLAEGVAKSDFRWAADAYVAFADRCGPMAGGDLRRAGGLYLLSGQYNLALAAENRALNIFDADAEARYRRGKAYVGLARYDEGIKDIRRAIEMIGIEHTTLQINWDLAHALKSAGHVCQAADVLDEMMRTHTEGVGQARPIAEEYHEACRSGGGGGSPNAPDHQADDLIKALGAGH